MHQVIIGAMYKKSYFLSILECLIGRFVNAIIDHVL